MTKLGFFTSLVYPDYRRLWIATGCAQSASWALILLRGALVYNLTQSNAWVGFVTMAAHLPSLVVTPFAGFLADRLDRRRVLTVTYSLNLAHNVILNQLMQQGARMLGPLLLLPVIHFIGHEMAFFVSTILYAIGWTQVARIRTASRGTVEATRGIFFNLAAGIGYIYTHPLVFAIMILTVLHCALTMAYEAVLPYFARSILGMTTVSQAMLTAAIMGASTAAFMTLSHGMIQALAPDGIRGRVMGANTWHAQGTMAGFNAINGVLMDLPWMTVPILLSGTGFIFVAIMFGSLLAAHLRAIYAHGIPAVVHAR